MGKLDLQRAFLGARPAPEDLKDQPGPVDDLDAPFLLQIALLNRAQRAVHHHEVDFLGRDEPGDLLDLALAEIGRGPR